MLIIRLSRVGKKNKPMYRLIISEKARDLYGRSLEILGSYNPYTKNLQAKADRIKYWLEKGSGMSNTINNLLVEKGIIIGKKVKASKLGKKKKEESQEEKIGPKAKTEAPPIEPKAENKPAEKKSEIEK